MAKWSALRSLFVFFFFNDTATTEIYTLSLHDALPICRGTACARPGRRRLHRECTHRSEEHTLNSSHLVISYAVFCLKKKKKTTNMTEIRYKTIFRCYFTCYSPGC